MADKPNRAAVLPFGGPMTMNPGEQVVLVATCLKPFMLHQLWFNPPGLYRLTAFHVGRGDNLCVESWTYDRERRPPWLPVFIPRDTEVKLVVEYGGDGAVMLSAAATGKLMEEHNAAAE